MFKFFTSDLRRNLIKILCLSVGLAVGFLLVARIYFEQTFDSFLPEIDRLYYLAESTVEQGEYKEYEFTPGGTAHELQRTFPQMEKATRITVLISDPVIKTEDGIKLEVPAVTLADTCLFDVFATDILEGDPHEVLSVADRVMIPHSLASKIGGDVIGKTISVVEWGDDIKAVIGGVYEDFPLNSTLANDVYLSIPTIGRFMWEGSAENMLGNDRYKSYVLLSDGADPDELNPKLVEHLKTKVPEEAFTIGDYKVWLRPLKRHHSSSRGVKNMLWMQGILACMILICAGLNYLLIVIGQLAARGKEMAIRKCYGTGRKAIFIRVLGESLFFLAVSLVLAILIAFSFSDFCNEALGYTPEVLFSIRKVWVAEAIVCLVLLIMTGVLPAYIYCKTPVAYAFRPDVRGSRWWKLILLAIQFFATGVIVCLLVIVGRQYRMVGNLDLGYDYDNIGCFWRNSLSDKKVAAIINEIKKLPFIEGVASADMDPSIAGGGNMMWTEGQEDNQINIADAGYINPEMIEVMGIKIVQGSNFSENVDSTINEVIVNERMVDVLQQYFGLAGQDIVGEKIIITGHPFDDAEFPLFTIRGVIKNIRRGGFESDRIDSRALVYFPSRAPRGNIFVRFSQLTSENLAEVQDVINNLHDEDDIYIVPYSMIIDAKREDIKRFGISVIIVGIAIILIALIGLIGYVTDEVNRRAKEIAIRKVNGTPAEKIVRLFCLDVMKVALPSLLAGGAVAMLVGRQWLAQFTDRVSLSPLTMLLAIILVLAVIMTVVVVNTLRVARSNPVDHLRSE